MTLEERSARRTVEGPSRSRAGRRRGVAVESPIVCVPSRWTPVARPCAGHAVTIGQIRAVSRGIPHHPHSFVAGRLLGPSRGAGAFSPRNPARQTHLRWLGGSLGAPRLSSPRREPEQEDPLAMTTDDLMKSGQIESVASIASAVCPPSLFSDQYDAFIEERSALLAECALKCIQ